MPNKKEITNDAIALARRRGTRSMSSAPRATEAWYDRTHDVISVRLDDQRIVSVARMRFQELADAAASDLEHIELLGPGTAVHFPKARAGFTIDSFVNEQYGSPSWMAQILGRVGGLATTRAKITAARENGLKGGRPKKASAMHKSAPKKQ